MPSAPSSTRHYRIFLGWVLLGLGLLGHLLAARAIGGTYLAYRDHIAGFVLIGVASALVIGALGWKFWPGRHDISLLAIGAVQAILGLVVYIQRFTVHG